jgi:hypothetical protein
MPNESESSSSPRDRVRGANWRWFRLLDHLNSDIRA